MAAVNIFPAYGRVYKTAEAMLADWKAGKDFRIANGPYCSVRDQELMMRQYWAEDLVLFDPSTSVQHVVARGLGV